MRALLGIAERTRDAVTGWFRRLDQAETPSRGAVLVACGVILAGTVARLVQYLHYRPLWLDESQVAVGILERPPLALLAPLADAQVAPPGYLLAAKAAIALLGPTEYAVRLPSILGGIAALVLVWLLARRATTPLVALLALGFTALCGHLIYYSAECKPYSTDAAVALLLTWLTVARPGRPILFGLVAAGCIWASFLAVFVLAGIALCQTPDAIRPWKPDAMRRLKPERVRALAAAHAPWVVSFAVLYLVNIVPVRAHDSTMSYMREYWEYAGAFMPIPPKNLVDLMWFKLRFLMFFDMPGGFAYPTVAACVWTLGVVALFRRDRRVLALLLLPVAMVAGASALRAYPFHGRMTLFLIPALFLPFAEGAACLLARLRAPGTVIGLCLVGLLAVHPAYHAAANTLNPKSHHQLDRALAYVAQHARPGDTVYLRYEDARAYVFCKRRYPLQGLVVIAEPKRFAAPDDQRAFVVEQMDHIAPDARLWAPVAYDAPEHVDGFLAMLGDHGRQVDACHFSGASAFAYEAQAR